MKKSEFKTLLKPLIKECIKEVMLEEGVLSSVVSEVVRGMGTTPTQQTKAAPVTETTRDQNTEPQVSIKLNETKNKMLEAIGKSAYGNVDLFEGTEPLRSGGQPGGAPSPTSFPGMSPEDPGVDISNILPVSKATKIWERLNR